MTISYVQTAINYGDTGPIQITLNVSAHSVILVRVMCAYAGDGSTDITASDGQGSYTSVENFLGGSYKEALLYLANANAGTHTIEITRGDTPGDVIYAAALEYSGVDTTDPVYAHKGQQQISPGSGTGAVSSGSFDGGTSSHLIVGMAIMENAPINQNLTAVSGSQRFRDTWGGYGTGHVEICVEDQAAGGSGTDATTYTSSLGTESDATIAVSLAPLVTHATIGTKDGHDTGAVAVRVTTGAAIAATDHADTLAASGVQLTVGTIAVTDAADRALVYTSLGTLASIAAVDQPDAISVATSLLAVPAGRSRHKRSVWVDGRMHYEKGHEPTPPPQGTPQERQRRAMLEWVEKRAQADARRITNKGMK